jgi:hypothetical protein
VPALFEPQRRPVGEELERHQNDTAALSPYVRGAAT